MYVLFLLNWRMNAKCFKNILVIKEMRSCLPPCLDRRRRSLMSTIVLLYLSFILKILQ